jgi:Chaperone of endosialidase
MTGRYNIYVGSFVDASAPDESNTIRIGIPPQPSGSGQSRAFIAGITGVGVTGDPVLVSADGQLGAAASAERFKDEIKPMDKASEAILALKPVTFQYKKEIDPKRIPQFGLVAEQVEKVNPPSGDTGR